ncbi:replicative DNA helicase [bacterium]|uniref:replicative DNA helicase n=1 Tax=Lachnospiraceae TaxID=186803 RepID=UPI002A2578F4|nr:replicative DNA helicase [bacterium]MDD6516004.1 replicative DNA helicase [bacterium]MDD7143120.1 replicative DNA helicase [bacterium]MDY5458304.1 replicative DNA helicase [Bariatricus sp.]
MDEALIKRVPPHSIEAEQSVVGAMLMDRDAITTASEIICGDDFYQTAYGVIFDSVVELFNEGKPVDLITLQNRLKEKDVPEEISSLEFVRDLLAAVPTSANVKYYAEIVAEKSTLRKMIKMNEEIANACYLAKEPVEAIMERTEKKVFELVQNRNNGDFVPIKQVVLNALEKIEKSSKSKGTVTGIPTGFIDLDYKTSGLQPSDLILVAARPSMGKTAFVLNIAQHVAFRQNKTVAIFSLEMSKEQLVNRLFSLESYVDAQLLRTGNLKDSDWEKLIEGAGIIGRSNLIIDDTPGISISEMRSKCRKYKLEHNLELIIIDYLQLMSGSVGGRSESRQQEISDISRSLKALARELHVPVISLSQLSRAVEQRPDHRPMLSDLRESGAIEQDADVVMFIYRDDYYNKDTEHVNEAEIIIAKQRNGPIGTVTLTWLPQYTKFANSQRKQDYDE